MEQVKTSFYDILNIRLLMFWFAVWVILYAFMPIHHADPTATMPDISKLLFRIYTVIPTICLLLIIAYEKKLKGWLIFWYKPFSFRFWATITYTLLPIFIFLDIYIMQSGKTISWGTFSSVGLMLLCIMLVAYGLKKQFGEVKALLIGVICSFFFMMMWEVIYQLWGFWIFRDIMNFPTDHTLIMMPIITMILPFIIIAYYYKVKLTRWSIAYISLFTTLLLIWLIPGDGWIIVDWGGTGIGWVQQDMNWTVYHIIRVSKIPLALLMGSLVWRKSMLVENSK